MKRVKVIVSCGGSSIVREELIQPNQFPDKSDLVRLEVGVRFFTIAKILVFRLRFFRKSGAHGIPVSQTWL